MKNINLSKLTEDDLFGYHFETTQEIASLARGILEMQREMRKHVKDIEKLELEIESRESQALKKLDKLN